MSLVVRIRGRLSALEAESLARTPPEISARDRVHYRLHGRPVVGFCSNDYLGLAASPPQPADAHLGAGSSRLICGDAPDHRALEARLAALVGYPDAVLFPSGYQLNVGVLPALLEPGDFVASDALIHASIIDGLRLSRVRPSILPHLGAPRLCTSNNDALTWWVTESIFSMDGDLSDPAALHRHMAAGGCTYVDDAHGFGLFTGGRGATASYPSRPTVLVATLSKACGAAGAFVAADTEVCRWIRSRARSFVFSTGMSPSLTSQLRARVEEVAGPVGDQHRARLWSGIALFSRCIGLPAPARSPIFPILVGRNRDALELSASLLRSGWHVQPIRPPTVPEGSARLRVTLSAAHSRDQIEAFAADLLRELENRGLQPRGDPRSEDQTAQ